MKLLSTEKRAQIIGLLCEGMSIRATSRITGAATNTVLDLLAHVGEACSVYQDENLRGLSACRDVQLDELFCFVGCKEKSKKTAKGNHPGDIWCWVAICSETKLRITWHIGARDNRSALTFCDDLAKRVSPVTQINSDGLVSYRHAVGTAMPFAPFAQLVKVYGQDEEGNEIVTRADKVPVRNDPDPDRISTSFIEASNLHMRMQNRRYARRTNAHSKKMANHCHMIALGFMAYNYARRHMTLKATPAMAAGIETRQWTMADIVTMADEHHEEKLNAAYEMAFNARLTPKRQTPKTYPPTPKDQIPLPWYLRPDGEPPLEFP